MLEDDETNEEIEACIESITFYSCVGSEFLDDNDKDDNDDDNVQEKMMKKVAH